MQRDLIDAVAATLQNPETVERSHGGVASAGIFDFEQFHSSSGSKPATTHQPTHHTESVSSTLSLSNNMVPIHNNLQQNELSAAEMAISSDNAAEQEEEEEEEEQVDVVEYILDVKEENGAKFFLLKWLGYPDTDCTWEPEENLRHGSEQLIYEFYQKRLLGT